MDQEQTVTYVLRYLGVPKEQEEQVASVIRGAYGLFDSMPELIDHVRECMKIDYGKGDEGK